MSLALDPEKTGQQLHTHDERLQSLELLVKDLVKVVGRLSDENARLRDRLRPLERAVERMDAENRLIAAGLLRILPAGAITRNPNFSPN